MFLSAMSSLFSWSPSLLSTNSFYYLKYTLTSRYTFCFCQSIRKIRIGIIWRWRRRWRQVFFFVSPCLWTAFIIWSIPCNEGILFCFYQPIRRIWRVFNHPFDVDVKSVFVIITTTYLQIAFIAWSTPCEEGTTTYF